MISPFGGSANRSASSAAVPRATSSNRFVSSRQTATGRSGKAAASDRSVAGRRCGDSNATAGCGQRRELGPQRRRAPSPRAAGSRGTGTARPRARSRREPSRRPTAPGSTVTVNAGLERGRDQTRARVVHAGKARVRDERDPLAGRQPGQQLRRPLRLVVPVIAEELRARSRAGRAGPSCAACPRRARGRPPRARGARARSRPRDSRSASRRPPAALAPAERLESRRSSPAPIRPASDPSSALTIRRLTREESSSASRCATSSALGEEIVRRGCRSRRR